MVNALNLDLGKTDVFQSVGIIVGDVRIETNNKIEISIGNRVFKLRYKKISVLQQLKKEIKSYGSKQFLIVYPVVTHFPGTKDANISFDIVGFRGRNKEGNPEFLDNKLFPFQFKVSGIWQFIPVCRVPCISVFRNKSDSLAEAIKDCDILQKSVICKPNHIPIRCGRSEMPTPYRYIKPENGDIKKEYKPFFVSILCNFDPETMTFNLIQKLAESDKIPKYYKISKEEKIIATKERIKKHRNRQNEKLKSYDLKDKVPATKKAPVVFEKPKLVKKRILF